MGNLLEKAKELPSAATIVAVSSYTQFLNTHAVIRDVKPEHWDFIISVAGVFVALSQLNHENTADNNQDVLLSEVMKAIVEEYPDFVEARQDCKKFVDRACDRSKKDYDDTGKELFLFSDSLGGWVVWNLFGHAPSSQDEKNLVRPLGTFIVHSFFSWWK